MEGDDAAWAAVICGVSTMGGRHNTKSDRAVVRRGRQSNISI